MSYEGDGDTNPHLFGHITQKQYPHSKEYYLQRVQDVVPLKSSFLATK